MKTFISKRNKYVRKKINKKTSTVRRHVYSRQTRKRKKLRNVRGGENFFGNVSNLIGKTARQIKSAVEVSAFALLDTSNVKRLHFKNQFFIDYMDIDTIRKLYADPKIIIKYDKHINDTTTTSDRLGQNGYLASPEKESIYAPIDDEDNLETVKEDNEFNDFLNYSIFSKDAISFNRLNNAEIIDPRFYDEIIMNGSLAETDKAFFHKKCIAFKNDDLHNAMFEMTYYWKYLLHSMLWDANDKTRYILYFLYSEFTKKILQNKEHVKKLRTSSYFIKFMHFFHELFRKLKTKKIKEELETVDEMEKIKIIEQDTSASLEVNNQSATGSNDGDSTKTQKKNKPLKFNDIITQIRGFFNVPYSIINEESNQSFTEYAKKNKKYTELPPYYTVIDVKHALDTVNQFLQKIIDTKNPKELMDIIYFKNSQIASAYNKVFSAANKKFPIIVKFEEYTGKYTFFKDLFAKDKNYRDSKDYYDEFTCKFIIDEIIKKQDQINKIIKDFAAKKENYESLENSKLLKITGITQTLVNNLTFGIIGDALTVKGGGLNDINERFGYYLEKKKSIIQEKYNKIISNFKSHPFLELLQCALFQSALHTYRNYIIEPMFPENPTEPMHTTLPLKLYKTLGLYSNRMANVVCQSPLNQIIKRWLDIAWYYKMFLKSPHCFKLGFLASMIREQWSLISPPIETPTNDATELNDVSPQKNENTDVNKMTEEELDKMIAEFASDN